MVSQITVDADRTVVAFYKFLKKHASVPFKLQKPASTPTTQDSEAKDIKSESKDLKDELWELYQYINMYPYLPEIG